MYVYYSAHSVMKHICNPSMQEVAQEAEHLGTCQFKASLGLIVKSGLKKGEGEAPLVVQTYNSSTLEVEARGLGVLAI